MHKNDRAEIQVDGESEDGKREQRAHSPQTRSLWSVLVRLWPAVNPCESLGSGLYHFSPFSSAYLFLYRPLPLCCQGDLCTLVLTWCGKGG